MDRRQEPVGVGHEDGAGLDDLVAAVFFGTGVPYFARSALHECADLYADILPEDAEITAVEVTARELRVQYRSMQGAGSFWCGRRADGSLDDVATLNRKIDFLWEHPEIVPRL
ncbi:hypothetical protein ABC977_17545 [Thioalkalicoccus limnaeus]|uniref:Uncharacterized protein n=1 Tax=Thioalkalicoccus limnaeus TaxID=120681 RepID=A0ABV4BI73_9GAMM